jgi:Spy/CpxP family protein refolding chaperone
MGTHDDFFKKMDAQLKKWDADVETLTAAGEKASAESREIYKEQVTALRADRDAAFKKLREMRAAGQAATLEMKGAVDAAWDTMKRGLDRASSNFKT